MISCTVYKHTSEDWSPCYNLSNGTPTHNNKPLVLISITPLFPAGLRWRVAVWGAGDDGMERFFMDKKSAMDCFFEVISAEDVTKQSLRDKGFATA